MTWPRLPGTTDSAQLDALPRTPTSRVAKYRLPVGHSRDEFDAQSGLPELDPKDGL